MRRAIASAVLVMCALAVPAGALTKSEKNAKQQCRAEYKEAKRQAGTLGSHQQRVDAKRQAKTKYQACVENAKRKA